MKIARGCCQNNNVISLEQQKKEIETHCRDNGYNLIKMYEDTSFLSEIQKGDHIVVAYPCCLNISSSEISTMFSKLEDRGICLSAKDLSNVFGRTIFSILIMSHIYQKQVELILSENML